MAQRGRPKKVEIQKTPSNETYLDKVTSEIQSNQSRLSLFLGALIILVVGILIFNYFNRSKPDLGPSQQTETTQQEQQDISPEQLPGKYTVKEEDTLFIIAEKYYQDGSKFEEIAKANNITDVNSILAGQVLDIPKLSDVSPVPAASETPSPTTTPSITPTESPTPAPTAEPTPTPASQVEAPSGTKGGSPVVTADDWGPKITGNTYTIQEGDWLSTIAGRAYGDIFAYQKIAEANNISNPDLIYPGQVLNIPR